MRKPHLLQGAYLLGLLLLLTMSAGRTAWAGLVTECGTACTWTISVDGGVVMEGVYDVDSTTGDVILSEPVSLTRTGYSVSLSEMSGNIDPLLGFGLGATNTSGVAKTFAFAFSLPLGGLPVPINTYAEVGTTLTAFTDAGGSIFTTSGTGKIVDSQDISLSPFPVSEDKGVDVGNTFSIAGKGTDSDFDSASGSIISGGPYDTMSVVVAFGLTDQTGVGLSGFVEQTAIPVPAAVWLFGSGLIGLIAIARRKKV